MDGGLSLATAFSAGILSFLSPCVIPILPTYTAFLAGSGAKVGEKPTQWRFLVNSLFFLAGFTLVFVAMGATASFLGQILFDYQDVIRKIGAVFMMVMGLHLLGFLPFSFLHREYRPLLNQTFQGPLGALILGIAFTAGWTPCTGPILASILVYAGTASTMVQGAFLLFVYAMGFAVPFFCIAVILNQCLGKVTKLNQLLPSIQKIAAGLLFIAGICVYFDFMQRGFTYLLMLFGY